MLKYRFIVAVLGAASIIAPAFAETVVTSPTGLFTGTGDAAGPGAGTKDTWYANNVRDNASVGITSAYADHGNGSVQFISDTYNSKADFEYDFSAANAFSLANLTALSYDQYRSSTSTGAADLAPAFRLTIFSSTSGAFLGSLVYEGVYNGQLVAPVNTFTTENIVNDYFWASKSTVDSLRTSTGAYTTTLAQWNALVPGGITVGGFTTGIGSGWAGSFDGAVDNISFATNGGPATTFNFEVRSASPVPEPSSIALLGTGMLSMGSMWMRRRKGATTV